MKILLSDPHFQPFRERKFESQKKNFFEIAIIWLEFVPYMIKTFFARITGKKTKDLTREEKILLSIRKFVEKEGIFLCISNGDFSESLNTEQGMRTREDLNVATKLREYFKEKTGITRLEENAGNHELGYNLPLCTDLNAGVYKKSMQNFLQLTNRKNLYHSFIVDGFKIILIPYLFSEDIAVDFDITAEKEKFLHNFEKDISNADIPVIIFIHDPDSFNNSDLATIIKQNRDRIRFIFYGHYHTRVNIFFISMLVYVYNCWWLYPLRIICHFIALLFAMGNVKMVYKINEYFQKKKDTPKFIKEFDAILIPAPTGMYGIGGGLCVLDLSDNESYKIEKLKI